MAGYDPAVDRHSTLVGIVAVGAAVLLALGAATLIGRSTSHRSMMAHVAAEGSDSAAPVGDHGGEQHPGMGIHLAGACSAILAAVLVVLGLSNRLRTFARVEANPTRRLRRHPMDDVVHTAGVGPPRLALCVELR